MAASFDLPGRTAVVAGEAKTIGRAVAECLAKSSPPIWVCDTNPVYLNDVNPEMFEDYAFLLDGW